MTLLGTDEWAPYSQPRERLRWLGKTAFWTAVVQSLFQAQLAAVILWGDLGGALTIWSSGWLLFAPVIVLPIVVFVLLVAMRGWYAPKGPAYILHLSLVAVAPFILAMPGLVYGANVAYLFWAFVHGLTVAGTVVFQDLVLYDVRRVRDDALEFAFTYTRFFIEKLMLTWLAFGSVVAVAMTLTWSEAAAAMEYDERVLWGLYSLIGFFAVSTLVGLFVAYPLFTRLVALRDRRFEGSGADVA